MGQVVKSDLQIVVNGIVQCHIPKSLKYQPSQGKNIVTPCTTGGESVSTIHSRDNTEAISKVTFALRPTVDNINTIDSWYSNIGKNVIELSDKEGEIAKVFEGMSLEAIPETTLGADGELEVTFLGDPLL